MLLELNPALESQDYEKPDSREELLEQFSESSYRGLYPNHERVRKLRPLSLADQRLPEECHRGYIHYLAFCWQQHRGIVISPDAIWQLILGELVTAVRADPERYRELFSETQEKQTIIVTGFVTTPGNWIPRIMEHLRQLVPTSVATFTPRFSTTSDVAWLARQAMFCDLVSPYYDYCVMLCGFPRVEVAGTREDWRSLLQSLAELWCLFPDETAWLARVQLRVSAILEELEAPHPNTTFFKDFLYLERCGSGSDQEVKGWLLELYRKAPELTKPDNLPGGLASVDFKCLDDDRDYRLVAGILGGQERPDGIREPVWGYCLLERLPEPEVLPREPLQQEGGTAAIREAAPEAVAAITVPFAELPTEAVIRGRRYTVEPEFVFANKAAMEKANFE